jgi:hypothetical protein
LISYGGGHASEIQIVQNQYVRNARFACCILSHVPSCWPHYVWLKGDFTYIAADGTATPLSGQTYISLPGGVPHALACGAEPCVFYVRYPQPFDAHVHPMPPLKK